MEAVQEHEILALIKEVDWLNYRMVFELFGVLKEWWEERGASKVLMQAVCEHMTIDPIIFSIYRHSPAIIALMEPLRRGEPVRRVKVRLVMSEEARRWWDALLVVRVLLKCDGLIIHARLLRWLGHQIDSRRIRTAIGALNEAGVIETFKVNGTDPIRPVTWHRLSTAGS